MKRKKTNNLPLISGVKTPSKEIRRIHQIEVVETLTGEIHINQRGDAAKQGHKPRLWDALVHTFHDRISAIAENIAESLGEQAKITVERDTQMGNLELDLARANVAMRGIRQALLNIRTEGKEAQKIRRDLIEKYNQLTN